MSRLPEPHPDILKNMLALLPMGFHAGRHDDLNAATRDPDVVRQWSEDGKLVGVATERYADDEHLAIVSCRSRDALLEDGMVMPSGEPDFRKLKADGRFPRTLEIVTDTHRYLVYRSKKIVRQLCLDESIFVFARGFIEPQFISSPGEIAQAPEWMLEGAKDEAPERLPHYKPQSIAELLSSPPPSWLVRDLLPADGLAVVFGEPGSGKSFLVLDLIAAIARGVPWAGQRTKKGQAVYLGLEAQVNSRVAAYLKAHSLGPDDLANLHVFQRQPVNLATPKSTNQLISDLHLQGIEPDVIVVDTLARALPGGDENSSTDMGAAIACAGLLANAFHCLCVLVHHSGKDSSRGARGHSSLLGAADAELAVSYDKVTGVRQVRATKMKDGADGVAWQFQLAPVDLGAKADTDPLADEGERHTSMVVDGIARTEGVTAGRNGGSSWTASRKMVHQAFVQAVADSGTGFESPVECSHEQWAATYDTMCPLREGLEGKELNKAKRAAAANFRRGVDWLVTERIVVKDKRRPIYAPPRSG